MTTPTCVEEIARDRRRGRAQALQRCLVQARRPSRQLRAMMRHNGDGAGRRHAEELLTSRIIRIHFRFPRCRELLRYGMKADGRSSTHRTLETHTVMAVERCGMARRRRRSVASYGSARTAIYKWLARPANPCRAARPSLRQRPTAAQPFTPRQNSRCFVESTQGPASTAGLGCGRDRWWRTDRT